VTVALARRRLAGCEEGAGTDIAGAVTGVGDELEATRWREPGGADDATGPLPTAGADAGSDGPGSRACPPSLGAAARRGRAGARAGRATATSIAGASRRRDGIALEIEADATLGNVASRAVPAGLANRPIAKNAQNTATHSAPARISPRRLTPGSGAGESNRAPRITRGRRSALSLSGSGTCPCAPATWRDGC
jgi:hypothetical protein